MEPIVYKTDRVNKASYVNGVVRACTVKIAKRELIKKENKIFLLYKEIQRDRVQNHIQYDYRPPHIW
jgi:hypothetical protein